MPQIKRLMITALIVSGALLALAGCSSKNKLSGFNTETGKHVENWYVDHRAAFLKNPTICNDCHGIDSKGGISGISCYSASFSGMTCHANGPSNHPAIWENPFYHGAAAKSAPGATTGFSYCQICHGNDFTGGLALKTCLNTAGCHGANVNAPHAHKPWRGGAMSHTDTDPGNAPVCATCHTNGANSSAQPSPYDPAAAPGCFNNTLCHSAVGHPAGWANPDSHGAAAKSAPTSTTGFSLCQTCHGNDFAGGTALQTCLNTVGCHGAGINAPHSPKPWRGGTRTHTTTDVNNATVCATCHTNGANSSVQPAPFDPAAAPGCFNNTLCHATPTCGTCHAIPPNGTVAPNVAGQHAIHIAVSTSISCATCHNGAGSGTALHQNGVVDVILDTTYNAKSGTAVYNPASVTCSNIRCHGGQTTPNWLTGTININTQCTSCHISGTTQYNSYFTSRHSTHSSFACTDCHDTTKLAGVHFIDLNTTAMINSYQTISSGLNYTGTSTTLGTCTFTCHINSNETHNGRQW